MRKILVTGGLGFIGSNLVDKLILDNEVVIIDDFSTGQLKNVGRHLKNPRLKLIKGSILEVNKVEEVLKDGIDSIVHLAAVVSVVRSSREPRQVHQVNVEGTLNVLESCLKFPVERLVFTSSAAVYGDSTPPPFREDSPTSPLSLYGATKQAGEAYINAYHKSHGLKTVILRLMNIYGPRRSAGPYSGVMMKFAEAIESGEPLVVYGDGRQTRDFTYVTDVTEVIETCLHRDEAVGKTLNIGTGVPTSVNELVNLFSLVRSNRSQVVKSPARPGEISASYANISKAKETLDYEPRVGLREGIELFMRWYRDGKRNGSKNQLWNDET